MLSAGAGDSEQALSELCEQYWYPLYAYARRRGHDVEEARDLTQAFFAKILEKQDLRAADPTRGRFRTFLLAAMKNFLAGEWRKQNTQRRGGGRALLSLDFDSAEKSYGLEPYHQLSPDAIFDRRWAMSLLERALGDLEERYQQSGQGPLFEALREYLGAGDSSLPYADLSKRLEMSEGTIRTAASRLRQRWRARLIELVGETVQDENDVQDELGRLISFLTPPG